MQLGPGPSARLERWPSSADHSGSALPPCRRLRPGLGPSLGVSVCCGIDLPARGLTPMCVMCRQLDKIEGVFERPSDEVIRELSRALRQALGVSLFGIDIIINNQTGQHAVIDINAFPGERRGPVSLGRQGDRPHPWLSVRPPLSLMIGLRGVGRSDGGRYFNPGSSIAVPRLPLLTLHHPRWPLLAKSQPTLGPL